MPLGWTFVREAEVNASPLGVQPAKAVLVMRGVQIQQAAAVVDMDPSYVGNMLNGRLKPSCKFRRRLATYLEMPESELFVEPQQTAQPVA